MENCGAPSRQFAVNQKKWTGRALQISMTSRRGESIKRWLHDPQTTWNTGLRTFLQDRKTLIIFGL